VEPGTGNIAVAGGVDIGDAIEAPGEPGMVAPNGEPMEPGMGAPNGEPLEPGMGVPNGEPVDPGVDAKFAVPDVVDAVLGTTFEGWLLGIEPVGGAAVAARGWLLAGFSGVRMAKGGGAFGDVFTIAVMTTAKKTQQPTARVAPIIWSLITAPPDREQRDNASRRSRLADNSRNSWAS
jgi:hypothetical protein